MMKFHILDRLHEVPASLAVAGRNGKAVHRESSCCSVLHVRKNNVNLVALSNTSLAILFKNKNMGFRTVPSLQKNVANQIETIHSSSSHAKAHTEE